MEVLFTFPSRYWFTIGLTGVFSLAGWSRRIRAEFLVFRVTQDSAMSLMASHTGLSPSVAVLSRTFRSPSKYNDAVLQHRHCVATTPVWALPRSLATTGGIISLFSSPRGTKMFQFPRLAPQHKLRCTTFSRTGCPIRKSSDQGLFAPTRSLSQLITSFIASVSLGIRHTPFLTFFTTVFLLLVSE